MATKEGYRHKRVVKRTSQGGNIKRAAMSKHQKRNYKAYRGQGR
jgi:hypothetical protein